MSIGSSSEVEVDAGGILNVGNDLTVDGSGAELLVQNGGGVGIANTSILNIGGDTQDASANGELVLAGTGAIIGPGTVALNGGNSAVDFEMTAAYTFANEITGIGAVLQFGPATVTLTGNNTYSGSTLVDATLEVGAGGTTGSLGSGAVVDMGTLAYNR